MPKIATNALDKRELLDKLNRKNKHQSQDTVSVAHIEKQAIQLMANDFDALFGKRYTIDMLGEEKENILINSLSIRGG